MKKKYLVIGMIMLVLGPLIATAAIVLAGSLDSSSPPASTSSYNLEDIYNRLDSGAAGTESTFQEPSSGPGPTGHTINGIEQKLPSKDDTNGATTADVVDGKTFWGLNSASGEWGEQTGENEVCVTCNGTMNGTRWCDNGDGTVTDMETGLVWLQNASWGGEYAFWVDSSIGINAHNRAAQLWDGSPWEGSANLSDGSVEGDWRLPTLSELKGLTSGTELALSGSPRAFTGIQSSSYWSSTASASRVFLAWDVSLYDGFVIDVLKTATHYVWPVRDPK